MEALRDNFEFCLFTGWFLFVAAIAAVESELYKHRYCAWGLVAALGFVMFILQNIYIYLY